MVEVIYKKNRGRPIAPRYYEAKLAKQKEPPIPEFKDTVMERVRAALGARMQIKNGAYFLDGFPSDLFKLVQAANERNLENGYPQIRMERV